MSGFSRVCVITRTKDRPLTLRRAVESVLKQTCKDWLHVIINDGGDPSTLESVTAPHLGRYNGRLMIIHNEKSLGMQNASNRALTRTRSEFVAIHDDDDSWTETFLAECVSYLDATGPQDTIQGVATQSVWIFEEIDKNSRLVELNRQDYFPFQQISLFDLAGKNIFPPIAFLYRREVHDHIGMFDQQFNFLGDWDFNIRFASKFDIGVIDRRLAFYHWRHKGSGSNYGNTVTDSVEEHRELAAKLRNHYLRADLEKGALGLGFVMNLSEKAAGQLSLLWDLRDRSDSSFGKLNYLEAMSGYFERITRDLRRFYSLKMSFYEARRRVKRAARSAFSHLWSPPAPPAPGGLQSRLALVDTVSFDVFDTVLLRKTKCPADVFLYMQSQARKILGHPGAQFPELRVNAEKIARDRASDNGYEDTNLQEIYSVLQEFTGVDDRAVDALVQLEIDSEQKLIYAHPDAVKTRDLALSRGKNITFTSDMYLPRAHVARLLEMNGFCAENLLVSSETRATKHSGKLFDLLVAKFGGDPAKILHIGDNSWSDFERPRLKGLKSFHWRPQPEQLPFVDQITSYAGDWVCDLPSSIYTGLARKRRLSHPVDTALAEDFWKALGYEVVGPLYMSFVSWLVDTARRLDIDKLFFLARDGYYLIKTFNILQKNWQLPIEASYIFASRRLLNVPRIRSLDQTALNFLTEPNPSMSLKDFLERVGLDVDSCCDSVSQFGFTSYDQMLTTPEGFFLSLEFQENIRELIKNRAGEILAKAEQERSQLLAYLSQTGITKANSAIVDIGWQASSIKSFRDLLGVNGSRPTLHGLYFSTWRFALGAMNSGCPVHSFYVHLDKPEYRANLIREGVELLEAFFGAPHPSVVGLEKNNGYWRPLYGQKELDDTQQQYLELARQAALEFVAEASQLLSPDCGAQGYACLDTVLERILCNPRPQEARLLGQLSHRNSFGGKGPLRYIAKVPSGLDRKSRRKLRAAYHNSFWKKGFMAQLTDKEKALLGS